MAAAQVGIIRRIQPHGPYNLGGFCISGVVALEVGRRLQEAGEQVGIALIVETRAHPPHVFNRLANAIARIAQVFGRLTTEERMELLMRMRPAAYKAWDLYEAGLARTIKRVARRALGLLRPDPAKAPPAFRAEVPSDPTGLAVLDPLRAAVSRANQLAIQAYLPRPFAFPVACFWGTEEPMSQETWRAVVPDLYLEAVPGTHNTCITTQVEALGRAMRTVLDGIHEQRLAAPRTGAAEAVQRPSRAARVAVAG
jgi:thioesterase domain-containing protein